MQPPPPQQQALPQPQPQQARQQAETNFEVSSEPTTRSQALGAMEKVRKVVERAAELCPNCDVVEHVQDGGEQTTLAHVHRHCIEHPDATVAYIHNKGSTHNSRENTWLRCSAQVGGDWTAHFKVSSDTCPGQSGYQRVCTGAPGGVADRSHLQGGGAETVVFYNAYVPLPPADSANAQAIIEEQIAQFKCWKNVSRIAVVVIGSQIEGEECDALVDPTGCQAAQGQQTDEDVTASALLAGKSEEELRDLEVQITRQLQGGDGGADYWEGVLRQLASCSTRARATSSPPPCSRRRRSSRRCRSRSRSRPGSRRRQTSRSLPNPRRARKHWARWRRCGKSWNAPRNSARTAMSWSTCRTGGSRPPSLMCTGTASSTLMPPWRISTTKGRRTIRGKTPGCATCT